jgi:exodeoxyribonuclease VII large subunit
MVTPELPAVERKIFSVSELNRKIKQVLEKKYAFVWISGEISNMSKAASGHLYLTLKDRKSQISSVIFRTQTRLLTKKLENGMQVTGFGRVGVYEPKGTYQIILEYLEKSGLGELLIELEALKAKLTAEGLFEDKYKKELPFLPDKIAVVTSPNGAAIEDILNISQRRFENIPIQIVPVGVQGKDAIFDIVNAFNLLNNRMEADVIILARGGGSVEDLQPFNSERVARAIFTSTIPVVSAVGHETDYTISDLVADLRAPTPSAAAELVLPVKADLTFAVETARQRMVNKILTLLDLTHSHLTRLSKRVVHPRKKIDDLRLRLDELHERLVRAMTSKLHHNETQLNWWYDRIMSWQPDQQLNELDEKIKRYKDQLTKFSHDIILHHRYWLQSTITALTTLNPKAILQRGYSITQTLPAKEIVRNADQVAENDELEIIIAKGMLRVKNLG